jgi:hypothetical protein
LLSSSQPSQVFHLQLHINSLLETHYLLNMSHDAIGAQNQPLAPLNTIHGRSNNGLKTHKQVKAKETKPAMEICDIKINDATMDLELAGRLTSTAIDQFLFFMNQVPL